MRVGIIGGGRAAWTFAHLFRRLEWPIDGVTVPPSSESRLPELLQLERRSARELAAHVDLLLLAVPDRAIRDAAHDLPARDALTMFHVSGSLDSTILPTRRRFSLHPLRALTAVGSAVDIAETLFVFEGTDDCETLAHDLVNAGGGRFARIAAHEKTLYHAAAVFASNYVAAICSVAESLFHRAGVTTETSSAIAALARSAIANWEEGAADRRFTGPVVRGDVECVSAHMTALNDDAALLELYALLGKTLVEQLSPNAQRAEIKALLQRVTTS